LNLGAEGPLLTSVNSFGSTMNPTFKGVWYGVATFAV
jgi:hypothetical protein